jgi:hypothetical protein
VLLPPFADLVVLALAGVALFGTIAYLVRGGRLFWVVVGGGIMTVVCGVLAGLLIAYSCRVIRVTGESTLHAERSLLLFSTTIELGGKDFAVSSTDVRTVIINETSRALTLRGEVYAVFSAGQRQPEDVTVAPQSVLPFAEHIDFVGPDEPLPREVKSTSSATSVTKYWLTW